MIIREVGKNLRRCGYTDSLLERDYVYDKTAGRRVSLAGFANSVRDSRTSCVCVLACRDPEGVKEEYVNSYRDLGAPLVFVAWSGNVEWWAIERGGARHIETIEAENIEAFFERKSGDLAPDRIWRAKNLGRVDTSQQLTFVDIGLMPLLEEEMGERLGGLMRRVIGFLKEAYTVGQLEQAKNQQWLFRAAFWVLCAKILRDKAVPEFAGLKLNNIDAVLRAVKIHYGAEEDVEVGTKKQRAALEKAAEEVDRFASLATLTTEAFAYMYENVLVDKKLRSALGIHATPSYLVDYIVWQLWPWIEEIPQDKRVVLEPACGHAPFLTGAMRLLRELFEGDEGAFHKYAKKNLIGTERDSFAREMARLSLTMADVPNPNGWKILDGDIYAGDTLSKQAKSVTILLCNPPFENFKPHEQEVYKKSEDELNCFNKAAEMLWRTLPYMPGGSVFGVILPRAFLHSNKKNLAPLRREILSGFELSQICELPENVFTFARHRSVLLFGRKVTPKEAHRLRSNRVLCRKVESSELSKFIEKYEGRDEQILQGKLSMNANVDLRVRYLEDVWTFCERAYPVLSSVVDGGQGFSFKGKGLPMGTKTAEKKRFPDGVLGYAAVNENLQLHELPDEYWMNLSHSVIQRPRWGIEANKPQIIVNYARVGSGPWRMKALIDEKGRPVTSAFLVFRIHDSEWSLHDVWAILNSPLANAYVYCNSMERHNLKGTVTSIPLPSVGRAGLNQVRDLVETYFALRRKFPLEIGRETSDEAKQLLLLIDAEVMRLYDLPPKMEKRVLDLFQGVQRKGVDFDFTGYYPEGYESAIPLHEYLSEEYKRSTFANVNKWVEENRSSDVIRAFEIAVDAFQDE